MYDPKRPYDNGLPLNRFERWFYPIFFGTLVVVGAVLSVITLVVAAVMIVAQTR